MSYQLGIDVGTTTVAAAVARDGTVVPLPLGVDGDLATTAVLRTGDGVGEVLVGETARQQVGTVPGSLVTGHDLLAAIEHGGVPGTDLGTATRALADLLDAVVTRAADREGTPPAAIGVTHPAAWGTAALERLRTALDQAGIGDAVLVAGPVAAAAAAARDGLTGVGTGDGPVRPGDRLAVLDLGGEHLAAAVVERTGATFAVVGPPVTRSGAGGDALDEALFTHVWYGLGSALAGIDLADPATVAAVDRIRAACRRARQAAATDDPVTVPVDLPGVRTEVSLTRAELEAVLQPLAADAAQTLADAIRRAGETPDHLLAVVGAGGATRTPGLTAQVTAELGRTLATGDRPDLLVARGAALAASASAPTAATPAPPQGQVPIVAAPDPATAPVPTVAPPPAPAGPEIVAAPPVGEAPLVAAPDPATAPVPTVAPPPASAPPPEPASPAAPAPPPEPASPMPTEPVAVPRDPEPSPTPRSAPRTQPAGAPPAPPPAAPPPAEPVAASRPPGGGSRRGVSPLLWVALVLALLFVAAGVVFVLTRTTDPSTTATGDGTTGGPSASPTTLPGACADRTGDFACITGITRAGGRLVVTFVATTPLSLEGGADALPDGTHHLHFFFNTVPADQAGVPGAGPWELWGETAPFTGFEESAIPPFATAVCVLIANPDHTVIPGSGNCAPIPAPA